VGLEFATSRNVTLQFSVILGYNKYIAIAKTIDNYIACNNLRDIRPSIENNEIINLQYRQIMI
jgi:hypothetical protein